MVISLYPDKTQTATSKKLADLATSRIFPEPVRDYFTPRMTKEAEAKRNKQFWSYNKPKASSDDSLTALLAELAKEGY